MAYDWPRSKIGTQIRAYFHVVVVTMAKKIKCQGSFGMVTLHDLLAKQFHVE